MGRSKDTVCVDKYALENVMLANETTAKEVSQMMGHAGNYLSQVVSKGGFMKRSDFENLKGLLRVTDSDIVKAVPVQRSDEVENIYSAYPVRKKNGIFLDEENAQFVEKILMFGGGDAESIVNAIVRDYRTHSELSAMLSAVSSAIKELT